jgi:NAD(P)-dependent dehydrogenase (short-subunit alcohol dehydrogenase family)
MNACPFSDKHAFVTGGTKGIGEAIVRRLAQAGRSQGRACQLQQVAGQRIRPPRDPGQQRRARAY